MHCYIPLGVYCTSLCILLYKKTTTLYTTISTWNLNISTSIDDIDMLHPSRRGGQCADISVDWCSWPTTWLPSCNHLAPPEGCKLIHKHALVQERRNVCICNMHACQAYLRHANYHSSLQNRARVLPSGALFEYFLLSPFFTQTVIYFLTTYCPMKVSPKWAQHGNSVNFYSTVCLMCTAMSSTPMPA